jgi:hypothetical protein
MVYVRAFDDDPLMQIVRILYGLHLEIRVLGNKTTSSVLLGDTLLPRCATPQLILPLALLCLPPEVLLLHAGCDA